MCVIGCSTPADCALPGSFPASEYSCTNSVCVFNGCSSDDICKQIYQSDTYVCRPTMGTKMCVKRCTAAADCAADQGAFSADNYQCNVDFCDYTGCTSDDECHTTMQNTGYRCAPMASLGYSMCQQACSSQSDCGMASAAYTSSHYSCDQNLCVYNGCAGDAECKSTYQNDKYVCR